MLNSRLHLTAKARRSFGAMFRASVAAFVVG